MMPSNTFVVLRSTPIAASYADHRPPCVPPAMSLSDLHPSSAAVRAFSTVLRTREISPMKSSNLGSI
jgi:hypothetical protein